MALMKADPENTVIVGDTINDILPAKKLSVRRSDEFKPGFFHRRDITFAADDKQDV